MKMDNQNQIQQLKNSQMLRVMFIILFTFFMVSVA